jgi:hypothetical protein
LAAVLRLQYGMKLEAEKAEDDWNGKWMASTAGPIR